MFSHTPTILYKYSFILIHVRRLGQTTLLNVRCSEIHVYFVDSVYCIKTTIYYVDCCANSDKHIENNCIFSDVNMPTDIY